MPHVVDDRVFETSTTTGTGPYTLAAAVPGSFKRWNAIVDAITGVAIAVGDTCWYAAWDVDPATYAPTGNGYEQGIGTYSATDTLTRTVQRSSNANAAVNWAAGTRVVAIVLLSTAILQANTVGAFLLKAATAEPSVPPAGMSYLYSREIVPGWTTLRRKGPSGVDTTLQDDLSLNGFAKWVGSNNTIASMGAAPLTVVGTLAAVTPSSGSAKNQLQRVQVPSVATAAGFASVYANNAGISPSFRGAVAGEGGFRYAHRFALNALQAGNRGGWGLSDVVTAPGNVDPTTNTTPGKVALVINANSGNWRLAHNVTGTAPTLIDMGANFPIDTTSLMELILYCRPFLGSAGAIGYRVRRYTTASDAPAFEALGTISTNIPAATTLLHPASWMTNNATAAAVSWHFGSLAIQRDW